MFKANNKAVSLMLFLVYLLLTLNITISFSSVVCKQAFFRLRMAIIVVSIITIYTNAAVIMTMTMIGSRTIAPQTITPQLIAPRTIPLEQLPPCQFPPPDNHLLDSYPLC